MNEFLFWKDVFIVSFGSEREMPWRNIEDRWIDDFFLKS